MYFSQILALTPYNSTEFYSTPLNFPLISSTEGYGIFSWAFSKKKHCITRISNSNFPIGSNNVINNFSRKVHRCNQRKCSPNFIQEQILYFSTLNVPQVACSIPNLIMVPLISIKSSLILSALQNNHCMFWFYLLAYGFCRKLALISDKQNPKISGFSTTHTKQPGNIRQKRFVGQPTYYSCKVWQRQQSGWRKSKRSS